MITDMNYNQGLNTAKDLKCFTLQKKKGAWKLVITSSNYLYSLSLLCQNSNFHYFVVLFFRLVVFFTFLRSLQTNYTVTNK